MQTCRRLAFLFSVPVFFASLSAFAQALPQPQIKDITDTRTTGQFFKGLKIELAFVGDITTEARGIRAIIVKQAVDSTGRSLLKETSGNPLHPYQYQSTKEGFGKTELALLNPARAAITIKDLEGEALFHVPNRDPASVIVIAPISKEFGKPVKVLEGRGIKLVVFDKATADLAKERSAAKGTAPPPAKNPAEQAADELVAAFTRLGEAFGSLSENDIQFILDDPKSQVVDFEVRNGKGEKIAFRGRSLTNGSRYTVSLAQSLPPDAQLAVYVATPKSVVSVPFKFVGVALP